MVRIDARTELVIATDIAKRLRVSAGSVEIVGGHTSKTKVVRAAGAKAEDLLRLAAGE